MGRSSRVRPASATSVMLLITLLGFGLRVFQLAAQSFWFDEGWSWYAASRNWAEMLAILRSIDSHPPLYYSLLKVWMSATGQSDFGLRYMSVLAGAAAPPLAYALGRRLLKERAAALVAAGWLALNPAHVLYSQETRMYALAVLLSGLAVYWAWRWWEHADVCALAGYGLFALGTLYTNYFGALVLVFVNLALPIGLLMRRNIRRLWQWAGWQLLLAGLLLPLTPLLQGLLSHDFAWRPTLNTGQLLFDAWRAATVGASPWLWQPEAVEPLSWFGLALGAAAFLRWRPGRMLAAVLYIAVPIGLMALLEQFRPVYTGRYVLYVVFPLALLVGAGAVALGRGAAWILRRARLPGEAAWQSGRTVAGVALALVFGWPFVNGLGRYYFAPNYARDDFRAVAAHIQGQEQAGQRIVLLNTAYPFLHYYTGRLPTLTLPFDLDHVRSEAELLPTLQAWMNSPGRVWLVDWQWEIADPQSLVQTQLRLHGAEIGQQWFRAGDPQWPIRVTAFDLTTTDFQATPREAVDVSFEHGAIRLLGFHLNGRAAPGQRVFVTLWWQLDARPARQYRVFTHLLTGAAEAPSLVASFDKPPLNDYYPLRVWPLGRIVQDVYPIEIPAEAVAPPYTLRVGLYDPDSGARLEAEANGRIIGDGVTLITLTP